MTRKKDTDQAAPKQAAEIISAGYGLDAIKARIDKMRQQSPVREPGEPAGRGPLPVRAIPALGSDAPSPVVTDPEILPPAITTVPNTPTDTSPISNELARTPLFAPIPRGQRETYFKRKLPSPEGINIWYSGQQLDMGDQDTYLIALMMAKGSPPDTPIKINRSEFIRLMGKKKSGASFKWLSESFDRISSARLYYSHNDTDRYVSIPLLGPLIYENGDYYFTIPMLSLKTFDSKKFGYIEWKKRRKIEISLSKWLQGYALSHAKGEHRITIAKLQAWSTAATDLAGSRERQFRAKLKEALAELAQLGFLRSWELYDRETKVKWIR